jgi:hypothetical protein
MHLWSCQAILRRSGRGQGGGGPEDPLGSEQLLRKLREIEQEVPEVRWGFSFSRDAHMARTHARTVAYARQRVGRSQGRVLAGVCTPSGARQPRKSDWMQPYGARRTTLVL